MIFLIGKIFLYLLCALALGVAAGWLWRNQQAVNREAAAERSLVESRGRLPRMETALRAGGQRLGAVQAELEARELELQGQAERLAARDRTIEELERLCAELRGALEWATAPAPSAGTEPPAHATDPAATDGADPAAIERVQDELEDTRRQLAAAHQHLDEARQQADAARRELEEKLAPGREDLERLERALAAEKRRVEELTRERELQRRALEALEQQLDIAREGRARSANG